MKYYQDIFEIEILKDKFVSKTLPAKEWTHFAHLTVGLWFVCKHGKYEASIQMPVYISRYNESLGNQNTETSGYHETITQFWIWLLDCYWQNAQNEMTLLEATNHLYESHYGVPTNFLEFYSKELIFSKKARFTWVEPDLQPLNFELIQ